MAMIFEVPNLQPLKQDADMCMKVGPLGDSAVLTFFVRSVQYEIEAGAV